MRPAKGDMHLHLYASNPCCYFVGSLLELYAHFQKSTCQCANNRVASGLHSPAKDLD